MNYLTLFIFIAISELSGILGSLFTASSIPSWYNGLTKPSFNPPSWVFGPVWTILYLLIGISGYLLWQARHTSAAAKWAIVFFFVQLALNALWTPLFFGAKLLGVALVEIIFMWLAIVATIFFAWQTNKWAAILLLPYLAWVSFASLLNYSLWKLN